jgi:DNA-binding response OmpR family regulator
MNEGGYRQPMAPARCRHMPAICPLSQNAGVRLLVVEDEEELAAVIAEGLRQHGFAVDIAVDGADALEKAWVNDYDVVVLDRDLPEVHGDDVCRQLVVQESSARILMLTASGELEQRVDGLSLGADDYLPKPFAFSELVARVRALCRRGTKVSPPVISRSGIEVDSGKMVASRDGHGLVLTRKEFAVLETLLRAGGGVVSAEALLESVWDENADPFTNAVRITVGNLRRKLGQPPVIETVIGSGYRIS